MCGPALLQADTALWFGATQVRQCLAGCARFAPFQAPDLHPNAALNMAKLQPLLILYGSQTGNAQVGQFDAICWLLPKLP